MSAKIVCVTGEELKGSNVKDRINSRSGEKFLGYNWVNMGLCESRPNGFSHPWANVVCNTDYNRGLLHSALVELCFHKSDRNFVEFFDDYLFYGKGCNKYKIAIHNEYVSSQLWSIFTITIPDQKYFNSFVIADVLSSENSHNLRMGYMLDNGDIFCTCC